MSEETVKARGVLTVITDKVRASGLLRSALEKLGYRVVAFEDVRSAAAYVEADMHLLDSGATRDLSGDLHRLEESAPVLLLMPPGTVVSPAFRQASAGFIAMSAHAEEYALRLEVASAANSGNGYRIATPRHGLHVGAPPDAEGSTGQEGDAESADTRGDAATDANGGAPGAADHVGSPEANDAGSAEADDADPAEPDEAVPDEAGDPASAEANGAGSADTNGAASADAAPLIAPLTFLQPNNDYAAYESSFEADSGVASSDAQGVAGSHANGLRSDDDLPADGDAPDRQLAHQGRDGHPAEPDGSAAAAPALTDPPAESPEVLPSDAAAPTADPLVALVADEDADARHLAMFKLRTLGFETVEAATVDEAVQLAAARDLALAVLADDMPPGGGLDLLERLRESRAGPGPAAIVTTAETTEEGGVRAHAHGAALLAKPFRVNDLAECVGRVGPGVAQPTTTLSTKETT